MQVSPLRPTAEKLVDMDDQNWVSAEQPRNVFCYLRVSGKGQIDGDGFPRQQETTKKFCERNGLNIQRIYREGGVSGDIEGLNRPMFSQLLADVETFRKNGVEIGGIVVERMDRFARDLMVSEIMVSECRKANLKVFSADQGVLIDMAEAGGDPTRTLIRQILAALAQWEKAQIVGKLAVARARIRASKGKCEGTKPKPFSKIEQLALEALSILSPGASLQRKADFLAAQGFETSAGRPYNRYDVDNLLRRMATARKEAKRIKKYGVQQS